MDRDLEGDGVLMCQPMGATCASHDAGRRPAHPGGRVGSLNAARPPTGAGGPRTQVAAMEPVSDTNPICASRVSSCQRRSYPSIPPLAGGKGGDPDARAPGYTVFANGIGMRTQKTPPCTQLFAYRAEQCYNTVSYIVHPTDSREASCASLFPVVYELRIVGA